MHTVPNTYAHAESPSLFFGKLTAWLEAFFRWKEVIYLRKRVRQLEHENRQLRERLDRDFLTGLMNRGGGTRSLREAIVSRLQQPVCLLMMDLDEFKRINDTYGHPAGDEVLQQTAQRLKACVRGDDTPCRFGGEEFAVILRGTRLAEAKVVAERIRQHIAEPMVLSNGTMVRVTTSIGLAKAVTDISVATHETAEERYGHVLKAADTALYDAKNAGRNRVVVYSPPVTTT